MKKIFIVIFQYCHVLLYFSPAIAFAIMMFGFKPTADNSAARVDQAEGIYIFLMSKPTAPYEYQGTVTKTFAWQGTPVEMVNGIIKKCQNEYPQANGIIFSDIGMTKAECIKFKQ